MQHALNMNMLSPAMNQVQKIQYSVFRISWSRCVAEKDSGLVQTPVLTSQVHFDCKLSNPVSFEFKHWNKLNFFILRF